MEKKCPGSRTFVKAQKCPASKGGAAGQPVPPRFHGRGGQDGKHRVSYRVNYTWNRGGRLKELRIRNLARKFLFLWAKKVFGRVLQSRARRHCRQKALQKAFGGWKDEWWAANREWKLTVRAHCHYRFHLYGLAFQAWRRYLGQQQEKKTSSCIAEAQAARLRLRWAWRHWLSYVEMCRVKHRMCREALRFREQSSLRASWWLWRQRQRQNQFLREMDSRALQHWARGLKFRAWLQWKDLLGSIQKEEEEEEAAAGHRRHRVTGKAVASWRLYVQIRREKKRQAGLAATHHHACIVLRCFSVWRLIWGHRQQLQRHQDRLARLAGKVALQRAFMRWKEYVALCAEARAHMELAKRYYRHHLLRWGMNALRRNVTDASLKRVRKNLAHRQQQVTLLNRFWEGWKTRLEQEEEKPLRPLTLAAHFHCSTALLRRYLRIWFHHTIREKHRKSQDARAERHRERVVSKGAFQAWKRFKDHQRWRRGTDAVAAAFHREAWSGRFFEAWRVRTREHREHRVEEEKASLRFEQQLRSQAWGLWRTKTLAKLEEREATSLAQEHHLRHVLRTAFCLWKENVREMKGGRMKDANALRFYSLRLLQSSWGQWRQYLRHRSEKWKTLGRAEVHYQRGLLGRVFSAWKVYQSQVWHILSQAAAKERDHNRALLRWALRTWQENVADSKRAAKKATLAEQHCRRILLCKVMLQWRDGASLCAYARQQKTTAVEGARKYLEAVRLKGALMRWKESCARSSSQRWQLLLAAEHHARRMMSKCMAGWRQHHLRAVRKRLLQRQGDQLLARRLSSTSFASWKAQVAHSRWEKQATVRSLWLWSQSLLGKAFDAWAGFVREQQRKKSRIERAAEVYRDELLRDGVTRFLRYTAGMKRLRRQREARQQVEAASRRHRSVSRCALLWKQKALCRRKVASSRLGDPLKKRVTFRGSDLEEEAGGGGEGGWTRPDQRDCPLLCLQAAGDSVLSELDAARRARLQPRRPNFLSSSLDTLELPQSTWNGQEFPGRRPPTLPGTLSSSPTGSEGLLPAQLKGGSSSSSVPFSFPKASPPPLAAPWPPRASGPNPELLPPSSFMTRMGETPKREEPNPLQPSLGSARLPTPGVQPVASIDLLLPEDFERRARTGSQMPGKEKQREEPEGQKQLEAELQRIGQKMQDYYDKQQELKSCQRRERILGKWLEMSTGAEDQAEAQQVQGALQQIKVQIDSLGKVLGEERPLMQLYVARVQDIRRILNT